MGEKKRRTFASAPLHLKNRAYKIVAALAAAYPDAYDEKRHDEPFASLISTILSAQCTDAKVAQVLPSLLERFPTPAALAKAKAPVVERIIHPLGLYRAKARYIIAAAQRMMSDFGGRVPDSIDALITLPGVGRKTANCVVLNAFGKPGIMCDTHCCRVTRRLGLHGERHPERIEMALSALLPPQQWGGFSHRIIAHGRLICRARQPRCQVCVLRRWCVAGKAKGK